MQPKSNLLRCCSLETQIASCFGDRLSSRAQQSNVHPGTIKVAVFESAAVEDALITVHFSSVLILDLIQFAFLCKPVNLAASSTERLWMKECSVLWMWDSPSRVSILMGGTTHSVNHFPPRNDVGQRLHTSSYQWCQCTRIKTTACLKRLRPLSLKGCLCS